MVALPPPDVVRVNEGVEVVRLPMLPVAEDNESEVVPVRVPVL